MKNRNNLFVPLQIIARLYKKKNFWCLGKCRAKGEKQICIPKTLPLSFQTSDTAIMGTIPLIDHFPKNKIFFTFSGLQRAAAQTPGSSPAPSSSPRSPPPPSTLSRTSLGGASPGLTTRSTRCWRPSPRRRWTRATSSPRPPTCPSGPPSAPRRSTLGATQTTIATSTSECGHMYCHTVTNKSGRSKQRP